MAISNSILSIIGFILSAYSVYVEHKVEQQNLHSWSTLDDPPFSSNRDTYLEPNCMARLTREEACVWSCVYA